MTYQEANQTVKRRYKNATRCPICKQPLLDYDNFEYIKYINGKRKDYIFFHSACLREARSCVNANGRV